MNSIGNQIKSGNKNIMGVMIESFLKHGNQIQSNTYGKSITDECIIGTKPKRLLIPFTNTLP